MKISILCSSINHPVNAWLKKWIARHNNSNKIELLRNKSELNGGDILFLVSCNEIIPLDDRVKYSKTLIIHASDLPKGRGWSPLIWSIIDGASEVTVSLLEAEDKTDSGDIWKKINIQILKTDLYDDINTKLFNAELDLMSFAVNNFENIKPIKQDPLVEPTYYKKRTPEDSELNPDESIRENFDLIRICDPTRFPAFFYYEGIRYKLNIVKDDER